MTGAGQRTAREQPEEGRQQGIKAGAAAPTVPSWNPPTA